ncbi:hypothetical protein AB0M57_10775 [Streptomyces sp. NPDC051597]|uniref:hypothetical protein n=1 Tax=Streptomyces sp. NPDC051597 TaxID=3155049 RepID=UPI0034449445
MSGRTAADVNVVEKAMWVLLVVTAGRVFAPDVGRFWRHLLGAGVRVGAAELTGRHRSGQASRSPRQEAALLVQPDAEAEAGWGPGE